MLQCAAVASGMEHNHFADVPSTSLLKDLLKEKAGAAVVAIAPTRSGGSGMEHDQQ